MRELEGNTKAQSLTKAVIHIGDSLELGVLAEGIETREQLDVLQGQGYRVMQGWLFARAMPSQEFESWLASMPRPGAGTVD